MSDRRYRQQGYRGSPADTPRSQPPSPAPPRGAMLPSKTMSRCAECGAALPITAESLRECPSCRTSLHTCRHCTHFDPARRFECVQPVAERIADKRARNECELFSLRATVEKDASAGTGTVRPNDARRAFGSLFKK